MDKKRPQSTNMEDRSWVGNFLQEFDPSLTKMSYKELADPKVDPLKILINEDNKIRWKKYEDYITEDGKNYGEDAKNTAFLLDSFRSAREMNTSELPKPWQVFSIPLPRPDPRRK